MFFTNRLTEQVVTSDDSVPREEHETMREQLKSDVKHLRELLEEALRKQDELALEAANAWQKVEGAVENQNVHAGELNLILCGFFSPIRHGTVKQSWKSGRSCCHPERRRTRL